ncbi:MAG: restriction endonuclease subunit S, partial [Candidatus Paceibacterota bacterium]
AEKNLQNARALFESHLNAVFTQRGEEDIVKSVHEVVESISTGPFGSLLHKADYEQGGIPLVNPVNIVGDKIVADPRKTVGKLTARRLSRYSLREHDIVIGRRGEIGRCAVVKREHDGWLCGTGSFFIRPSGLTNSDYLAHLLRSQYYRRQLERLSGRATMPSISNSDLANLVVRVPPLERQKQRLRCLECLSNETQRLASIYRRKLTAFDELKKSLLNRAFSGQL